MKKITALLLALLLVVSLCACQMAEETAEVNTTEAASATDTQADVNTDNAAETQNENTAEKPADGNTENAVDADTAIEIVMKNKAMWVENPGECNIFLYGFLDLDFDGTPELVTNVNTGERLESANRFFKIDAETKTLTELEYAKDSMKENQCDFNLPGLPSLYLDKSTGEKRYKVADKLSVQGDKEYRQVTSVLYLDEEGKVRCKNLWAYNYMSADITESGQEEMFYFIYDDSGNTFNVNDASYSQTKSEFEGKLERLGVNFPYINGEDFAKANESEQKSLLKGAYEGFSYEAD